MPQFFQHFHFFPEFFLFTALLRTVRLNYHCLQCKHLFPVSNFLSIFTWHWANLSSIFHQIGRRSLVDYKWVYRTVGSGLYYELIKSGKVRVQFFQWLLRMVVWWDSIGGLRMKLNEVPLKGLDEVDFAGGPVTYFLKDLICAFGELYHLESQHNWMLSIQRQSGSELLNSKIIWPKQKQLITMRSVDLETVINQMQGDDLFRKTLFKVHEKSPVKKKTQMPTKLPSMRMSHTIGTGYAMGEVLGEGGYGRVRLCTRREDSQQVVIKTFAKFKLTTEEKRRSVMREIEIMKCIKHRNIIRIVDFFETSDSINIVMEHFSRTSLAAYARTNRPISDTALRKIIKQIAEAIAYLHRMKITHRDLKPENVLINEEGEIKLIDLGLSLMGEHSQVRIAGTPYFMCPQLLQGKEYDPFKADLWAFGILLYWLVLGYFPQDSQQKKKGNNHKFELNFPADMHPGIEYLISKMLAEDPTDRIQAEQVLIDTWIQPKDFKNEISKLISCIPK